MLPTGGHYCWLRSVICSCLHYNPIKPAFTNTKSIQFQLPKHSFTVVIWDALTVSYWLVSTDRGTFHLLFVLWITLSYLWRFSGHNSHTILLGICTWIYNWTEIQNWKLCRMNPEYWRAFKHQCDCLTESNTKLHSQLLESVRWTKQSQMIWMSKVICDFHLHTALIYTWLASSP